MEPSRQEDGGPFPPVEEIFDHFRNEDGTDGQKWVTFAMLELVIEHQDKKIHAAVRLGQLKEPNLLLLSLSKS